MKTYIDENNNTVKANNYQEASEKLYGQHKGFNGCNTTYARTHRGYADILVFKENDKIGTYYGAQSATPVKHILTIL